MGESTGAVPAVERRRWPRRSRHHEAHVHWKHIAVYVPIVLLVTLLGGLAIWSFIEKQSLVIIPEPPPRVTLVTADTRSPAAAAWVRLLNSAAIETTLVSADQAGSASGVIAVCDPSAAPAALRGRAIAILGAPPPRMGLRADAGASDATFKISENPSPILARLAPGTELPSRVGPVAFLKETPQMHVDARCSTNARAAIAHWEQNGTRVLWLGLAPDAVWPNPSLLLLLRTGFRWLGGQPISDGAAGDAVQAATMAPASRRVARDEHFAFSVDPLRDRRSLAVRMINRGAQPIRNPTVLVWVPPGATRVTLGGDWIMQRGASVNPFQQDGAFVVGLPSLDHDEERVLKLTVR